MEDSTSRMGDQKYEKSQQLVFILLILAPIVYVIILLILQIKDFDEITYPINLFGDSFLNILLITFILLSIGSIIMTHVYFIPLFSREDNLNKNFGNSLVVITLGGEIIAAFGLVLGVLWWEEYAYVPFFLILPFIGTGMIHGYYLYYYYILNDKFRKKINERKRNSEKYMIPSQSLDPTLDIFKPIVNHLNKNEKILLNYNPKIRNLLILGIVGAAFSALVSFFIWWLMDMALSISSNNMNYINIYFLGFTIFFSAILPIIIIFKAISLKKTMFVFTSEKIIAKYLTMIRKITYNEITSSIVSQEKFSSQEIKITFEKISDEGIDKDNSIYLNVPRDLNLLEKLETIMKTYSNKNINENQTLK